MKSAFLLIVTSPLARGFDLGQLFQARSFEMRPDLLDITNAQVSKRLNLHLHIGYEEEEPHMSISNLVIELHHDDLEGDHAPLPAADGPRRALSSGPRRLDVLSKGSFVSMAGTQCVDTVKGCWEMAWRKGKPGGSLICSFEIPQDYRRNDAVLPKGPLYISVPVYTKEGLKVAQYEKERIQGVLAEFLMERDEALAQMDLTENPIMRAIYLQKALAAVDEYTKADHRTLESIPTDDDILLLQDDLLLANHGLLWGNDPTSGHVLLGRATVTPEEGRRKSRLMP